MIKTTTSAMDTATPITTVDWFMIQLQIILMQLLRLLAVFISETFARDLASNGLFSRRLAARTSCLHGRIPESTTTLSDEDQTSLAASPFVKELPRVDTAASSLSAALEKETSEEQILNRRQSLRLLSSKQRDINNNPDNSMAPRLIKSYPPAFRPLPLSSATSSTSISSSIDIPKSRRSSR